VAQPAAATPSTAEAPPTVAATPAPRAREESGVQKVVAPPADRDALLQRLRERALRRAETVDDVREDAS
jgi:hypothetical protein